MGDLSYQIPFKNPNQPVTQPLDQMKIICDNALPMSNPKSTLVHVNEKEILLEAQLRKQDSKLSKFTKYSPLKKFRQPKKRKNSLELKSDKINDKLSLINTKMCENFVQSPQQEFVVKEDTDAQFFRQQSGHQRSVLELSDKMIAF